MALRVFLYISRYDISKNASCDIVIKKKENALLKKGPTWY